MATSALTSSTTSSATTSSAADVAAANRANAQKILTSLSAGSGVDVNSLAQNLVDAERVPRENAINAKITKNDARVSGISAISYTFSQVQTAFQALNDQSDFTGAAASVGNTSVVSAVAGANSTAGSHDLTVTTLARAQRTLSTAFTDGTTALSGSDLGLSLTVGTTTTNISVTAANSSPQGIVSAINAAAVGIRAQLVNTNDGSATPYKIILTGNSGTQNAFSVGGSGSTSNADVNSLLGLTTAAGQQAADADFTLDGVRYVRSSNLVTDALPGVSLSMKSLGTSTIQLSLDTSSVRDKVTALVAAYNDARTMLNVVSDPKSSVETYGATLVNDPIVSNMRTQLRELFMTVSSTPGSKIKSVRDLGISLSMTGEMTLDQSKLDGALQDSYDDVVTMFTGNLSGLGAYSTAPNGVAGDANRKLTKLLGNSGTLKLATDNINTQTTRYKDDLTKLQTRMSSLLIRYQKQFAAMDGMVGQNNSLKASLKSTFDGMAASNNN